MQGTGRHFLAKPAHIPPLPLVPESGIEAMCMSAYMRLLRPGSLHPASRQALPVLALALAVSLILSIQPGTISQACFLAVPLAFASLVQIPPETLLM